jgi:hypothetical protein
LVEEDVWIATGESLNAYTEGVIRKIVRDITKQGVKTPSRRGEICRDDFRGIDKSDQANESVTERRINAPRLVLLRLLRYNDKQTFHRDLHHDPLTATFGDTSRMRNEVHVPDKFEKRVASTDVISHLAPKTK